MFPVCFDFQKLKAVSRLIAMASFTLDVVCNHLPLHHTHTHHPPTKHTLRHSVLVSVLIKCVITFYCKLLMSPLEGDKKHIATFFYNKI